MSIKTKLLYAFLVTTLVPVLVVAILITQRISSEAKAQFTESSSTDISIVDQTFTTFFDVIGYNVSFMADLPVVRNLRPGDLTQYFGQGLRPAEMANAHGGLEKDVFDAFSAIGENNPMLGYVYMSAADGGYAEWPGTDEYADWDPRETPWHEMGQNANYSLIRRDGYYWEPDDAVYVSVIKGFKNSQGQFGGVVAIDVSLKALTDMVQSVTFGETGYVIMIEGSGTVLVDGGNVENNFKNLSELTAPHYQTIAQTNSGVVEFEIDGVDYMANVYQSPSLGWKFVGVKEKSEIFASVSRVRITTAVVSLIMVLVLISGATFIAQRIVRPINTVKNNLRTIAEGEGDLTNRIEVDSKDETGELARWFNQFMASTQELIQSVKDKSISMDTISNDTSDRAELVSQSTTQQLHAIDQIVTATTEMSSAASEVASNSVETASISEDGLKATRIGKDVLERSTNSVRSLVKSIESSNADIQALAQETNNINNILTTIQDIAEQTNLLALNAAIEAARAGEQGRGFAVVADEVRNLAKRTQDSTEEINLILRKLVDQTHTVSATMEQSARESETSAELANEAFGAFEQIETIVEKIRDMTTQTASATEEQHLVSKDINQNLVTISDSANEVNSLSEQVSALCRQQSDLGRELSTLVARFRT
ncbi:methyl-accepting chemotaxis protein [Saccharospirillum mangrovi]|uniref:methyl-accepting chemotaxis protein n=1 Tax=Saccharospirillum mangrovi TaxID=2161747 RepID=UPI000D340BEF|nr:methyl-accepting chemotaxis protein [Saccharospirillum mangrovi]